MLRINPGCPVIGVVHFLLTISIVLFARVAHALVTSMLLRLALLLLLSVSNTFALGGSGSTCDPSTTGWPGCTRSYPSWESSVTTVVNIPAGHYSTPYTAGTAYRKYVLQGDMTADGSAILIGADYVTIDLNGYTITYNQTTPGEGVSPNDYNRDHVSIRNGSIIQGAAMSEGDLYGRGNNPVTTYNTLLAGSRGIANLHVANLYVQYGGRDVGGIVCAGNDGLYENNTIEDTYEFGTLKNRQQGVEALTGAKLATVTGNIYRYNTIINTRQRGIVTGNNSEVYQNNIDIRSIATNSVGVSQYEGKNIIIRDNTIVGGGEHPIGVGAGGGSTGSDNIEIYNNLIDLQTTALGEEYGGSYPGNPTATYEGNSAACIRVTWGGDTVEAYNNQCTIVTDDRYTGTYSPTGATAYIDGGGKGFFIGTYPGETSIYRDNTISVTGDGSYNYGVTCSESYSEGLYVVGNAITSSQYNIVIGDDYGPCNGFPLFMENTLIKSGARADYKTYINTYNSSESQTHDSYARSAMARIVENTYSGGAAESSITLQPSSGGTTDIYFGHLVGDVPYFDYRLHDNNNTSSTLINTTIDPAETLPYTYPVYTPPTSSGEFVFTGSMQ